ncbi:MAG: hypothetical protein WCV62_00040 [Candidatus Peribacteraceae bacterium]
MKLGRTLRIGLLVTAPLLMGFTVLSERDPEDPRVWNVVITPEQGEELDVRVEEAAGPPDQDSSSSDHERGRCFIRDGAYVRREVGSIPARYIPCTTTYPVLSSSRSSSRSSTSSTSSTSSSSSRTFTSHSSSRMTSTASGALSEAGRFPSVRNFPSPMCGRAITIPILLQGEQPLSVCIL